MTTGQEKLQQLHTLIDEHAAATRRMMRAFAEHLVEANQPRGDAGPTMQQPAQDDQARKKFTMTKSEFAERVGISVRTLETLLQRHDVSCTHIGTRVLFTEAHALELLSKFEAKAVVRKQRPIRVV